MDTALLSVFSCVAIASLAVSAAPIVASFDGAVARRQPHRTITAGGVWIPHGFEAFEKSITAKLGVEKQIEQELVDCPEVPEPSVPSAIPLWATDGAGKLRAQGFEEVSDELTGKATKAFISGSEVVLKKCSAEALEAVVRRTGASPSFPDPLWDIYFDCAASRKWTIKPSTTLQFGKGNKEVAGTWRLLAPHFNVILHGSKARRIMQVMSYAHVTVSGIKFKHGAAINMDAVPHSEIPAGGWNGGAVMVFDRGALTAYKCEFTDNRALSYYARWGGGGAIKSESESFTLAWGCTFDGNEASVGGAVSSSSAHVLYVRNSSFVKNSAFGGVDASDVTHGHLKPRILVRGGAIRVDSVAGHDSTKEHVLLCNSEFKKNKIVFGNNDLVDKFGYEADDLDYLRASGAAITAWNNPGTLLLESGNTHFMKVTGCVFEKNKEKVAPEGAKLGGYVFEIEGAGHCELSHTAFRQNKVERAVARLDNSVRFSDGMHYEILLNAIEFADNGNVYNLEFAAARYDSTCSFFSVDGFEDTAGDCREEMFAATTDAHSLYIDM